MGDPIENNLLCSRLSSLNRILPRVPIQEDIQFRHFGDPTTIDFTLELDRELHSHSLPPIALTERVIESSFPGDESGRLCGRH